MWRIRWSHVTPAREHRGDDELDRQRPEDGRNQAEPDVPERAEPTPGERDRQDPEEYGDEQQHCPDIDRLGPLLL